MGKFAEKFWFYLNGDESDSNAKENKKGDEKQSLIYRRIGLFLGAGIALFLSLSLLLTGMASIPLIGPGSFVPVWLGSAIFIALFVAPLSGMGWYNGKWLDTWKTKHFSNEPLFMSIFLTAGLVFLTVLALAQPQITIPFVLSSAGWNWLTTSVFVINYTAAAGSFGNFFGRVVDTHTKNRSLIALAMIWFGYHPKKSSGTHQNDIELDSNTRTKQALTAGGTNNGTATDVNHELDPKNVIGKSSASVLQPAGILSKQESHQPLLHTDYPQKTA